MTAPLARVRLPLDHRQDGGNQTPHVGLVMQPAQARTPGPRTLGMPHIGTGERGDLVIAVTRAFSAP